MRSDSYYRIDKLMQLSKFVEAKRQILEDKDISGPEKDDLIGNLYFYRKDYQKAIDVYEALILKYPDYYPARYHYLLGILAERKGNYDEALGRYRNAIDADPLFLDVYMELGVLFYKKRDLVNAVKCLELALKIEGNDLRIYYNIMRIYEELSRAFPNEYSRHYDRAKKEYDLAKTQLPALPQGYIW